MLFWIAVSRTNLFYTGAHIRPAALPKPIIISVPKPHCWKGSASKPYVELPPHTAPLGMGVGPAQACAVQVVVHDPQEEKKEKKSCKKQEILRPVVFIGSSKMC